MKKIYIITTYTGTTLSCLIQNISNAPYAHVSIALNEDLDPMYSFGRLNPKTALFAGFVEEKINEGLYAIKTATKCRVYSMNVTEKQFESLKENINFVSENRKKYSYDVAALIRLSINRPRQSEYKYVCSHFVADMLIKSGINIFSKPSYEIQPNDFYNHKELELRYEGLLNDYPLNKEHFCKEAQ